MISVIHFTPSHSIVPILRDDADVLRQDDVTVVRWLDHLPRFYDEESP